MYVSVFMNARDYGCVRHVCMFDTIIHLHSVWCVTCTKHYAMECTTTKSDNKPNLTLFFTSELSAEAIVVALCTPKLGASTVSGKEVVLGGKTSPQAFKCVCTASKNVKFASIVLFSTIFWLISCFSPSVLLFSSFFSFISFCVLCKEEVRAGRGGIGPPKTGTRGVFNSNPEGNMLLISLILENSSRIRTNVTAIFVMTHSNNQ